jgi:hypothetical protein
MRFHNSQSISEAWVSSIQATTSDSIVEAIVAAFDEVHRLTKNKKSTRLSLRFSFVLLIHTIDALKAATKERLHCLAQRKPGYSNASLAIDIYLNAKTNASEGDLSRVELSEYRRIGMRWSQIAGASPLQLSVYSDTAETIMCVPLALCVSSILNRHSNNNSIKPASLQALAAQVQETCPELAYLWTNFTDNRNVACSEADVHHIQNLIAQTRKTVPLGYTSTDNAS